MHLRRGALCEVLFAIRADSDYGGAMRLENDSMGELPIPNESLFGASTQRAILNFPISRYRMPEAFVQGLGLVKWACAEANEQLGLLPPTKSSLIRQAAREIADGRLRSHFPVDVFQTGSGTSTNMNVNEVIANRASQLAGEPLGSKRPVHPNDDVNLSQSSNDVIPSALHVSITLALDRRLAPRLEEFSAALGRKAAEFSGIIKVGRTHMMDATPITLGQEFSGYAAQAGKAADRVRRGVGILRELAIGGTAVGTGINSHPEFGERVCRILTVQTGCEFVEARNHFEAQAARDDCVELAGILTAVAVSLTKIANDVRLLGSGPRAGLAELQLPPVQPGSSIMPGKVNPVMSEMLVQVSMYVQGLMYTVGMAGRDGHLELNATLPLLAHCLHDAIDCLTSGVAAFTARCVDGIAANPARCSELVEGSLMLAAALNPHLGYDVAAAIAKEAYSTGRTLREIVLERQLMEPATLDRVLDPRQMTSPLGRPHP